MVGSKKNPLYVVEQANEKISGERPRSRPLKRSAATLPSDMSDKETGGE
jgi:hypothetical protein